MRYLAATIFAVLAVAPVRTAAALTQQDFVDAVQKAPSGAYVMPTLVVLLAALLVILGMARVMKQS